MNAPKFVLDRDAPRDVEVTVTVGGHGHSFMMSSAILDLDSNEIAEESIHGRYTARALAVRDVRGDVDHAFSRAYHRWKEAQTQ